MKKLDSQRYAQKQNIILKKPSQFNNNKITYRGNKTITQNQDNIFKDAKNIWRIKTKNQQKQYQALRKSQLFSQSRKITFVKFNYRTSQSQDLSYDTIYDKLLKTKTNKLKTNINHTKGTMNISELWSQKNLKQAIGNPPFPRDRYKIIKIYSKNNNKLFQGQNIHQL